MKKISKACVIFLAKTLTQKNIDYDNSFEQTIKDYGLITIPITLEHKMRRISNIIKKIGSN